MFKKIVLGIVVIIFAASLYLQLGGQPEPLDHNTYSAQLLAPGPLAVSVEDVELVDTKRTTQPSGDYPGSDKRTLLTRIWWPTDGLDTPRPLVIYSHGFMSTREGPSHFAEHLASNGYIVVAPDFPLSNFDAPGPQLPQDVVNQPGDVKFLIDTLLARGQTAGDPFEGAIDPQRIAAVGMSLGGMTTALVAYHPSYYDPRIKLAISVAGPSDMFTREFFASRDIPFFMIASKIDAMVPYATNAADILQRVNNATLLTFDDGSHAGFSYQARSLRFFDNADQIGCWAIAGSIDDEVAEQDNWVSLIGNADQGIVMPPPSQLCTAESLPPAMNPIRQQELEALAVTSFLQWHFADQPTDRERYKQFLLEQLTHENQGLSIQRSK